MANDWTEGKYTLLSDKFFRYNSETEEDEEFSKGDEVYFSSREAKRRGKAGTIAPTDSTLAQQARGEIEELPYTPTETVDDVEARIEVLRARQRELRASGEEAAAATEEKPVSGGGKRKGNAASQQEGSGQYAEPNQQ